MLIEFRDGLSSVQTNAVVDQVTERLCAGEVVVLPTDTVYGLVAVATDTSAVDRIRHLKGRPESIPIAVLVGSTDQAFSMCGDVPIAARRLARRFWPGPITLVLDAESDLPDVSGRGSIGVRVPDCPLIEEVALRVGPLAASSANRHGEATPAHAAELAAMFSELLVVDGGPRRGAASTVVDCTEVPVRIIREGVIPARDVEGVAGEKG